MSTRNERHKFLSTHFESLPSELSVRQGELLFPEELQLVPGGLPGDYSYLPAMPSLALIAVDSSKWSWFSIVLYILADDGYRSKTLSQSYSWPIVCLNACKETLKLK